MGIIIASAITTLVVVLFYGYVVRRLSEPLHRRALLVAALAALPLQPMVFYAVRVPLDIVLASILGRSYPYFALTTFYAPLTEEPAKWLVLLIPLVWRALSPRNAPALSLAVGLGFGVGEIWFLTHQLIRLDTIAAMPFWMFTGFLFERFVVVFLHGAFVALFFQALAERRNPVPAALTGMALHYLLNFPLFLASVGALGLSIETWQLIAQSAPVLMAVALALVIARQARAHRPIVASAPNR